MNNKPGSKIIYTDMRDAIFEELYLIARKDRDVILLVGDQGAKSFEKFQKNIPSQFINMGPAEQNIISVAAGLALGGKKVFTHAIASFITSRCYEQIKIDIGLMNLPVTILGVGGGYSYESDGPTHHSNQDLAIMRAIPGLTILNASDPISLANFPALAYNSLNPVYIRFDKGNYPFIYKASHNFKNGLHMIKPGNDLIIVSTGIMTHRALEVAQILKEHNIKAGVIDLYRIKPINENLLLKFLQKTKNIITIEEHLMYGGIGTIISDFLCDHNLPLRFKRFGLVDNYCFDYGSRGYMHKKACLDVNAIVKQILLWLKK